MAHAAYTRGDHSGAGGLLSTLLCGSDPPFVLCDGPQDEVDFDLNPTGVFVGVHTKQWHLVVERTKIYPHEASTWVIRGASPVTGSSEDKALAPEAGSTSSDRFDVVAVASPRAGPPAAPPRGPKVLRWRMLPLHLAVLFCAPSEVIKTLLKAHPAGCSALDDQGMLPLHLAFRSGCSEEIVLLLLEAYPEAIECVDHKGRLPSVLAPKKAMSYADCLAEAFVKGPAYYYWASRVATAERVRGEAATAAERSRSDAAATARVQQLEEEAKEHAAEYELLVERLSRENADLSERVAWYEATYDGAEEKEHALVEHTNGLAERLRLTSLSEEHLATKLAKIEGRLHTKETEFKQARTAAAEEKEVLEFHVKEMEQILVKTKHKEKSLTVKLEKKITEANEVKVVFEQERQQFALERDASKECLMELITSSKQGKRAFEHETKELRRQLAAVHAEGQHERRRWEEEAGNLRQQVATLQAVHAEGQHAQRRREEEAGDVRRQLTTLQAVHAEGQHDKRKYEEEAGEARRRLATLQQEASWTAEAHNSGDMVLTAPRSREEKLDGVRQEVVEETRSRAHRAEAEGGARGPPSSSTRQAEVRGDGAKQEAAETPARPASRGAGPPRTVERAFPQYSRAPRDAEQSVPTPKGSVARAADKEEPFDTYVSTKSSLRSCADDTRDDTECFSHLTDVDTAMALGELSEEQRLALEELDLSGSKEEIAAMLSRVPGLTHNQVNLLVDVASSLTV